MCLLKINPSFCSICYFYPFLNLIIIEKVAYYLGNTITIVNSFFFNFAKFLQNFNFVAAPYCFLFQLHYFTFYKTVCKQLTSFPTFAAFCCYFFLLFFNIHLDQCVVIPHCVFNMDFPHD